MSLLWTLKKAFDPTKQKEDEEDQKEGRLQLPEGLTEGDGDDIDTPAKTPKRWVCAHCGFESTEKKYCGDCLVLMDEAR